MPKVVGCDPSKSPDFIHTLSLYNEEGERYWAKFHFRTDQGIESIVDEDLLAVPDEEIATADRVADLT